MEKYGLGKIPYLDTFDNVWQKKNLITTFKYCEKVYPVKFTHFLSFLYTLMLSTGIEKDRNFGRDDFMLSLSVSVY